MTISIFEKIGKYKLQELIDNSNNYKEILEKVGLSVIGNNYKTLKEYILKFNIDTSGIEKRRTKSMTHTIYTKEFFIESLKNGTCTLKPSRILKKLIEYNIKEYRCEECGISEWNGKEIILELHHKDGKHSNNKLENLQILCPNCHSQTENFRYKNRKND